MNYLILVAMTITGFLIGTQAINCYTCKEYIITVPSGQTIEELCQDADITPCRGDADHCVATSSTLTQMIDGLAYVTDSVHRNCATSAELEDEDRQDCSDFERNINESFPEGTPFSCEEQICESDACNTLGRERFQ